MEETPVSSQIKKLLLVILSGAATALFFSIFFLYFYGPSGSYRIEQVLLNPSVAEVLKYPDVNASGKQRTFVFDHIEFLHFNEGANNWKSQQLTQESYGKFYALISGDKSLSLASDELKNHFYKGNPAIISIVVREEGVSVDQVFQEVQLTKQGDYYRVQIHEQQSLPQWAYFNHPGIYDKTLRVLGAK